MSKFTIVLLLFVLVVRVMAGGENVNTCLEYMTTNHPNSSWVLQDDSNGQGVYIKQWNSTMPKPSIDEAKAMWPQAAPWKSNQVAGVKSDLATWKDKDVDAGTLACALQALVVCINKRLPATNKITAVEFKTELKEQLKQ